MGGSGSTRRVTVEEKDTPGVVKISESVVQRLKGQPESQSKHDATPTQPSSQEVTSKHSSKLVREEAEVEIKRVENFYKERIKELEYKNAELYQTSTEQFAKAVEEVEQKFLKTTASPVCSELQDKVLKCYQENPKYPLICSAEVKAFHACVHKARENVLTRKG